MTRTPRRRISRAAAWTAILAMVLTFLPVAPALAVGTGYIRGVVSLGTTGNLAGAGDVVVTLLKYNGTAKAPLPGVSAQTDAVGAYEITGLDSGRYDVVFTYQGTGSYQTTWTPYTAFFENTVFNTTIGISYILAGHVSMGPDGRAAGANEVRVTVNNNAGGSVYATTYTDAAGNFTFGRTLPAIRSYYLEFDVDGAPVYPHWYFSGVGQIGSRDYTKAVRISPAADMLNLNATVGGGAGFGGVVRDSAGNPIAGQTVSAVERFNYNPYWGKHYTATTDAEGRYMILGVPSAFQYQVQVGAAPYAYTGFGSEDAFDWGELLDLSSNTYRDNTDFTLYRSVSISGTVWGDVLPESIAGQLQVWYWGWSDSLDDWYGPIVAAVPAGDGTWSIHDLPPGEYVVALLYFQNDDAVPSYSRIMQIDEGGSAVTNLMVPVPHLEAGTVALIRSLYADFLDRSPSQQDLAWWGMAIQRGEPRGSVVRGFVNSDEYRLLRIDAAYEDILGRASDSGGRMWWLDKMKRGLITTDDIEQELFFSKEYRDNAAATLTDVPNVEDRFITAIYRELLHREPDAPGLAFWHRELAMTNGPRRVVTGIWRAPETAGERVAAMYEHYLGREPDPSGLLFWVTINLAQGDSPTRAGITESGEYWNLALYRDFD